VSAGVYAAEAAGSFVFGLLVGGGLSVIVERTPEPPPEPDEPDIEGGADGESRPKSHFPPAPKKHPHGWLYRCLVMGVTGIAFLLAYFQFEVGWRLPLAFFFIAVTVVLAFIDWDLWIIPNVIVLPAIPIGLAAAVALDPGRWWVYLVACVGAAAFLFILALVWEGGMGLGDVNLALLMGAVLGATVIVAMFLAFLVGSVVGLALMAAKLKTRKDHIPFGPYLAFGSVIALLYGHEILGLYRGLIG
jgi:prepilin signal peptidase PulO-like enzyme (type II secretory pathway)